MVASDDIEILARFGQRLREARKRHGLSQEGLAAACGLDRTYVGGIERGERNVGVINITRISQALALQPGALLND